MKTLQDVDNQPIVKFPHLTVRLKAIFTLVLCKVQVRIVINTKLMRRDRTSDAALSVAKKFNIGVRVLPL